MSATDLLERAKGNFYLAAKALDIRLIEAVI